MNCIPVPFVSRSTALGVEPTGQILQRLGISLSNIYFYKAVIITSNLG